MDDPIQRFLRDHDARCPDCGYELRSCTSGTCPECGLRLTLTLRASREYRSWLILVISLSFLAGHGIQRWILEVADGLPYAFLSMPAPFHWHMLNWSIMLSPVLLAAALLRRRWFARQAAGLRWVLASIPMLLFVVECLLWLR